MRYLIASDIHGSAYFCRELLTAFRREGAERLILLGDLLYHGPRNPLPDEYSPQETASLLNSMSGRVLCVRGNCDSEVDQMMLEFPIMAEYALMEAGGRLIYVTHGHIRGRDDPPKLRPGDVLLHGHTHIPACERLGEIFYLNPGSVSLPKEGAKRGYAILENGVFSWKELGGAEYMRFDINSSNAERL